MVRQNRRNKKILPRTSRVERNQQIYMSAMEKRAHHFANQQKLIKSEVNEIIKDIVGSLDEIVWFHPLKPKTWNKEQIKKGDAFLTHVYKMHGLESNLLAEIYQPYKRARILRYMRNHKARVKPRNPEIQIEHAEIQFSLSSIKRLFKS